MGQTFTVKVWTDHGTGQYNYFLHWEGQSMIRAFIELFKAKRQGYGCIKLEWRPT